MRRACYHIQTMAQFDETAQNTKLAELHRKEEEELIRMLSGKYGHQYINLRGVTINSDALRLIDESKAHTAEIALFEKINKRVRAAIRNPNNKETKDALAELERRGFEVEVFMVSTASLEHAWARYEDIKRASASQKGVLDIEADAVAGFATTITNVGDIATGMTAVTKTKHARTVSETLEVILGGALALRASDIHIEPEQTDVRLRLRIDGALMDVTDISRDIYELLRSRLKLLSGLKLNITNRAQDGRFTINIGDRDLEIRSSVIPGAYGESVVMRILDPSTIGLTMEDLGINNMLFSVLEEELKRLTGMIITTGPTGSGKTTSLYAFLRKIHRPEKKVVTLEDPIEYHLEGIVQTQITDDYDFATGLRAILRQDPDVIMVGEIRDRDVAETAIHAALTGHIVFSTLHTNSAAATFARLLDLGVDARSIGSAVNLIIAQRLTRRLCPHCKQPREATEKETELIRSFLDGSPNAPDLSKPFTVHDAVGCEQCGGTGYRGRIGIYEGIIVDSAVASAVIDDTREDNILAAAAPQRIPNLQQDGLTKVLAGLTSLAELENSIDLYGRKGIRHGNDDASIPTETA